MIRAIDSHKLNMLRETPVNYAQPDDLQRVGKVFFIGGNLPIYSTLETMYESYCLESSELFHVTFGTAGQFDHNLEMVRQIKRNFSIRLMGRTSYPLSASQLERVYLAGLDVLDISRQAFSNHSEANTAGDGAQWLEALGAAVSAFPRWSIVSTIPVDQATPDEVRATIHDLLGLGVIPLLDITGKDCARDQAETGGLFSFLAAEWHRHRVPLRPVMPLLRLTTPFDIAESSGFLRDAIGKLQDRGVMATSDLRRHLRTSGAQASFDSAGL
ncbi:MAG: hypothetical protein M0023_01125 [Desulfobacteraceae bacterium]|nr:hypothetical protein [Desulfobacteraceae bacterium]